MYHVPTTIYRLLCVCLLVNKLAPFIRVFSYEFSLLCIRWPKYWSFSFSISPSNASSGLISFGIDPFDLAVQGTPKSLPQHHSFKGWRPKEKGVSEMRWFNSITDSMDLNLSKLWEIVKDREAWSGVVHGATKSWTWFSNWITTTTRNKPTPLLSINYFWYLKHWHSLTIWFFFSIRVSLANSTNNSHVWKCYWYKIALESRLYMLGKKYSHISMCMLKGRWVDRGILFETTTKMMMWHHPIFVQHSHWQFMGHFTVRLSN